MRISAKQESVYMSARAWSSDWKEATLTQQMEAKQQQMSGIGPEPPSFRVPSSRG